MPQREDVFEKLGWREGRMVLGDLIFEIDDRGSGKREPGESGFSFLKPKRMIDQYARFWQLRKDFAPRNIMELGIHAGGSIVFWFEIFRPDRLVAIDIALTGDSSLFQRYVASRGLQSRIKTYWETSQADSQRLKQITASDFSGPLDLVFDDASHLYRFSKVSFETLFPLLRPGGLYIIEDWSWACWSGLPESFNPSMTEISTGMTREEMPLVRLICEIVVTAGKMEKFLSESDGFLSLKPLIANVHVYPDFVVIERGEASPGAMEQFELERDLPKRQGGEGLRSLFRRLLRKCANWPQRIAELHRCVRPQLGCFMSRLADSLNVSVRPAQGAAAPEDTAARRRGCYGAREACEVASARTPVESGAARNARDIRGRV